MSTILILVTGLISLLVGYLIAQPFLGELSNTPGVYPEYFNDSRNDTYREALENLDYAYQSNVLSQEEFELQKELLLKDAAKFVTTDKG